MSGTAVGKFFGEFGLDIDPFIKAVRGVQSETKSLENSLKPLTKAAEDIGKSFTVAGAAITGAFGLAIKQAADYGDAIRDASVRTGIGTAAFGGLKLAVEQSGGSFEDLNTGLKKLAVNADAAAKGSKEQVALFKSMGVAIRDTTTGAMRPMADILGDVSEHFKNSTNATKEAGEAVALFGRNGTQLIEFLELGKAGLQGFQEKAERLGLAIGTDVANQADNFKDTMNDLQAAWTGASLVVGNALMPALTDLMVMVTNGIVEVRKFVAEHQELVKVFAAAALGLLGSGGLLYGLSQVLTILPKIAEAWKVTATAIKFFPLTAATAGFVALSAAALYFENILYGGFVGVGRLAVMVIGALVEGAGTLATAFGATGLGKTLTDASKSIMDLSDRMLGWRNAILDDSKAVDTITPMIEKFKAAHARLSSGVVDNAEAMKEAAKVAAKYREALNEVYREHVEAAGKFVKAWLDGFQRVSEEADRNTEALERNQVAASKLAVTVGDMHPFKGENGEDIGSANIDAILLMQKAWEDANGKEFDDSVELFNKINGLRKTDLDDKVEFDEAWDKALKRQNEKRVADYKKSIDDIKKSAGSVFDDMFVKGEGVFKSLQNMLKGGVLSLGRTIFEDITGALLGPVLNAFRNFFNTTLKGIIDGALGGIGKSIGGALAGIFGSGSKNVWQGPLQAGAAGTAGATGFGISGASLAAFATNPITIGIAAAGAAALAIKHFVGQGRKKADEFGEEVQSPFGAALAAINNPFDAMKAAGTLTLDAATKAKTALTDLWNNFTTTANQFATEGKNQAKVVSQAFATMTTNFGPGLSNLFSKIDSAIAGFSTGAVTSTGAIAGIPTTGRALSASSIFADAVDVFKSVVDRVSGGGGGLQPISVSVSSAPVFHIEVGSDDLALQVRDVILPAALKDFQGDVNTVATKLIQILKPRWESTPSLGGAVV